MAFKILPTSKKSTLTEEVIVWRDVTANHSQLAKVKELYSYGDKIWIVYDFCDGDQLSTLLREIELTEEEMAYICKSVLTALLSYHLSGRVHKDVRPDNILVSKNAEVKLGKYIS